MKSGNPQLAKKNRGSANQRVNFFECVKDFFKSDTLESYRC